LKKSSVVFATLFFVISAAAFAQAPTQAKPPAAPPSAPPQTSPAVQHQPAPGVLPTKIAVINMAQAIASTKEGQKAMQELNTKFAPKQAEDNKRKQEIDAKTTQLTNGQATMSDDAKRKLQADIVSLQTALKRFEEDAQQEMEADNEKIGNDLQNKIYAIATEYCIKNGYAVLLNVGDQSPVLWASAGSNITDDVVKQYDAMHPATVPPAAPAAKK
jgi:outer membrane protein